ncbi:hypothetical protein HQ535_07900, partial [bacterium]|nr:hypothetical protein [bacterium]
MKLASRASGAVRGVAVALTVVFAALTIVIGQSEEIAPIVIEEGAPAPQTFIATERVTVVDVDATESARDIEASGVPDVFVEDSQTTAAVLDSIQDFFENARAAAEPLVIEPPDPPGTVGPSTTTTTTPAASVLAIAGDSGE